MVNVTVLDNGKPWSKRSFGFRMFEFIEFDHFLIFSSLAGLMMNTDMTVLRDVPQCSALAGAVPCNLIDFAGVTTAFGFAVKMEELYE